jgi:hypothetical protein
MNTAESTRSKDALELRATRFKDVNPLPTTAENAYAWKDKISALKLKYITKQLRYLYQRQMYWLSMDQILPQPSPFRVPTTLTGPGWTSRNSSRRATCRPSFGGAHTASSMAAATCTVLGTIKMKHVTTAIIQDRQQSICFYSFTQFEEHLGLYVNLTDTEKRIGLDINSDLSHIINKKINVQLQKKFRDRLTGNDFCPSNSIRFSAKKSPLFGKNTPNIR